MNEKDMIQTTQQAHSQQLDNGSGTAYERLGWARLFLGQHNGHLGWAMWRRGLDATGVACCQNVSGVPCPMTVQ